MGEDALAIFAAALLFSAGISMFVEPAGLIMGGATGLATAIRLWAAPHGILLPIGGLMLLLNLPLLVAVWIVYGKRFIFRTILCTVSVSLATDLIRVWPKPQFDPLLAAVFGGITVGCSIGLLFVRGYNTGGTDLVVYLIRKKKKSISPGRIVLFTDCAVIFLSALLLDSWELIFYSVITIYVQSKTIDLLQNGYSRARACFIISEKNAEIAAALTAGLERGITVLNGSGYFTGKSRNVLLCAVSKRETYRLKALIREIDPTAFLILTDAAEISGYGFEKRGV